MKNKKIFTVIILAVLMCSIFLLFFYKNQQNSLQNKAEKLSTEIIKQANIPISDSLDKNGNLAYNYLEYFQKELPGRIAFSETEEQTAITLLSFIMDMGYDKKNIEIQEIKKDKNEGNGVPVQHEGEPLKFNNVTYIEQSHNIVVTKKGGSEKTIIVGAHYDSAGSHGVDDNGSGVSLLLEVLNQVKDKDVPYTIKFVFFGAEEIGLIGSNHYVGSMNDTEIKNTLFMINIDSVLAGDVAYLYGGRVQSDGTVSKDEEVKKAYAIAESLHLDIHLPPKGNPDIPFPTGQKRSDHAPFNDKGIPYVYFEANNWEKGSQIQTEKEGFIMHTNKDDLEYIEGKFPNRARSHLEKYSALLNEILTGWE